MTRPLRSLLAPDAVAALVAAAYGLSVTGAVLLRTLINDVYRVDTARGPLVLKLYRHGRDVVETDWEARLADHLAGRGVPVVAAVPLADGSLAGTHAAPEGERAYVLWQWAPGALPGRSIGDRLAGDFGRTVAAFHSAADAGAPPAPRARDLDAPGPILERLRAAVEPADRKLLDLLAAALPDRLGRADLDRGICHGDVSLDNVHADGDRLVLYDLDLAATDWRAADLTGVATTPWWPAFLAGYRSVRPFGDDDLAALPWFTVRGLITNLYFHLVDKPTFRGADSIGEGWADRELSALRTAAGQLLA